MRHDTRNRLLPALLFTAALLFGGVPAAAQEQQPQQQQKGDGAQPIGEYDNVPDGLMMMRPKKADEEPAAANNNGDMAQVMNMNDIKAAYENKEYAIAAAHLKAIASDSYPEAEELLGIMYQNGQGVQKNTPLALKWLNAAANAGRGLAAHYLAITYYTGDGVQKNPVTAAMWLYIAVNDYNTKTGTAAPGAPANDPDKARAAADLNNILLQIGRRDRAHAYDLARGWLEEHNMTVTVTPP
ncbi:MAG: sel1 repeat family protein [Alphaproteobacteria bacterium]|nr:sel1 repeat family protein [Alphaproteobacteria bacterium]MDE2335973.1 sel1 repeat family protein [Alphaproteobacteria bacterium]